MPTRLLSVVLSSRGSRKASRRSGEQRAAGRACHSGEDLSGLPRCLRPQPQPGGCTLAGEGTAEPHAGPGAVDPEGSAPPPPRRLAGRSPSTVTQRSTSFWLLITRGLDDSTGTQICGRGQRTGQGAEGLRQEGTRPQGAPNCPHAGGQDKLLVRGRLPPPRPWALKVRTPRRPQFLL